MMRVFFVACSDAHAKLPVSSRIARRFSLPPRTRTTCTRFGPSLVIAAGRPSLQRSGGSLSARTHSNLRFFRYLIGAAPDLERFVRDVRVIPERCVSEWS